MTYAMIPNPNLWSGNLPASWYAIAEGTCPDCNEKIGYDNLCKLKDDGKYYHDICPASSQTEYGQSPLQQLYQVFTWYETIQRVMAENIKRYLSK